MSTVAETARVAGTAPAISAPAAILRRKCACGGDGGAAGECAACRETKLTGGAALQRKLAIGSSDDPAEREADEVAERVMRMASPGGTAGATGASGPVEGSAPVTVQCRASGGGSGEGHAPAIVHNVLSSPGRPLDADTRGFFEPRFGRDLSHVRVHSDARAAESAAAVHATAYTVGHNLVFGRGAYAPGTDAGRRLMAHELAHVGQQETGGNRLQRDLLVAGPEDPEDPLHDMDPDERNEMIRQIVEALGDGFTVVSLPGPGGVSGQVVPTTADFCEDPAMVAAGGKPVGDCCLCLLTRPGSGTWTIRVVLERGASTNSASHVINIPASTSPAVSGHWTTAGARRMRPRVITFAHEVCGHAALMEVGAHPDGSRVSGTRHDPTVLVERAVSGEQGLPAGGERGLASAGVHRGESFTRVEAKGFPNRETDPARLPTVEQDKLKLAVKLAFLVNPSPPPQLAQNRYVDVIGHADRPSRTATGNQRTSTERAQKTRKFLVDHGLPPMIPITDDNEPWRDPVQRLAGSLPRFTDVRGVSDSECHSSGPDPNCRKVQVFLASFPAGTSRSPPGTPGPSSTTPVGRAHARAVAAAGDACIRKVVDAAWPP